MLGRGKDRQRIAELEERVGELEARLDHERLFPVEWANRRIRDQFGDEVRTGPLRGMRYPDWAMARVDLYAPKVLGSFERELHDAVGELVAAAPPRVVNIGCAEGYYVVGLAVALPRAEIIAFETREEMRRDADEIAAFNDVAPRVDVRGTASLEDLRQTITPGAWVLCDCDGAELELLDPVAVPALREAPMIVEAHDLLREGITPALRERFAATHEIEEIPTRPRFVDDHPELDFLPLVTQQLAISEFRGGPMSWLVMRPRAARAG